MKKILTSLLATIFILLLVSPAVMANEMKLYRSDSEHYSISIPSDWEYQDVKILNVSSSLDTSLLASSNLGQIYIQKNKDRFFSPIEEWKDIGCDAFIRGFKDNAKNINATFIDSGQIYINNQKLLWIQAEYSSLECFTYIAVNNNSLYTINYLYPIDNREKALPKVTESINSLKFKNISQS